MAIEVYTRDGQLKKDEALFAPNGVVTSAYLPANTGAITANTLTKVALSAKEFDPFAWFDTTNFRFQPKAPGYYRITGIVTYNTHASAGLALAQIFKNGAVYREVGRGALSTAQTVDIGGSCLVYLNGATDYVELFAYAGQSVALIYNATGISTAMYADLVASSVGVAPEPWQALTLTNSWTSSASPYPTAAYMKDPHGFVHLRGNLIAAANTAAFTLPAGYRPVGRADFSTMYWTGAAQVAAMCRIENTGVGTLYSGGNSTPTAGWTYILDGLTFRAEG